MGGHLHLKIYVWTFHPYKSYCKAGFTMTFLARNTQTFKIPNAIEHGHQKSMHGKQIKYSFSPFYVEVMLELPPVKCTTFITLYMYHDRNCFVCIVHSALCALYTGV